MMKIAVSLLGLGLATIAMISALQLAEARRSGACTLSWSYDVNSGPHGTFKFRCTGSCQITYPMCEQLTTGSSGVRSITCNCYDLEGNGQSPVGVECYTEIILERDEDEEEWGVQAVVCTPLDCDTSCNVVSEVPPAYPVYEEPCDCQ